MFLTLAELQTLTGYRRPGAMIRKLRDFGLRYFVAADGYPRVARSEIESPRNTRSRPAPAFDSLPKCPPRV